MLFKNLKINSIFEIQFKIGNRKTRNWQFSISIKLENKMILSVHGFGTRCSSFFVFRFHEEIEKGLLKKIKIKIKYGLHVIQEQVLVKSPEVFRCAMVTVTQNPLFRKKLIYFIVYTTGCYFHIWFILIVYYDIKDTRRSSHRECSPKVIPKSFINLLIVKIDSKLR